MFILAIELVIEFALLVVYVIAQRIMIMIELPFMFLE